MGCDRCAAFDAEVIITTPGGLRDVVARVRSAVDAGTLSYNSFESSRELVGQPSFMDLDGSSALPDVLRYHFDCQRCGNCYGLFVATFHGSGGKWARTGRLPASDAKDPSS